MDVVAIELAMPKHSKQTLRLFLQNLIRKICLKGFAQRIRHLLDSAVPVILIQVQPILTPLQLLRPVEKLTLFGAQIFGKRHIQNAPVNAEAAASFLCLSFFFGVAHDNFAPFSIDSILTLIPQAIG